MLQNAVIKYCAPTLAGLKTGNIFMLRNREGSIIHEIRLLNNILTKKGLRLVPVKQTNKSTMVYLYRPDRLRDDLSSPDAVELLIEKGYSCKSPECCISQLTKRLMNDEEFPHEIGLFLGYPPADVKGFIESPHAGFKCIGCWKVYGNEKEARKLFNKYKKCTEIYCRERKQGKPLEALIV